jgi:hypothetical protein
MDLMERHEDGAVKRAPLPMTPENVAEIRRGVEVVVALMMRRHVPIEREDAYQQAWMAGLEVSKNWREDGGARLSSYVIRAGLVAVRLASLKASCPVTASKAILRRTHAARDPMFAPARPDQSPSAQRALERAAHALAADEEAARSAAEAGERTASLRRRMAYKRALARLPAAERRIAEVVVSRAWLGLPVRNPGEFIEAEGLGTRQQAARALRLLREAMLEERGVWDAARSIMEQEDL